MQSIVARIKLININNIWGSMSSQLTGAIKIFGIININFVQSHQAAVALASAAVVDVATAVVVDVVIATPLPTPVITFRRETKKHFMAKNWIKNKKGRLKDEEIVNRYFFAPLLFLKVEKKSFYDNPEVKEGLFAGIASLSGSQLKDLLTKKITKTKN